MLKMVRKQILFCLKTPGFATTVDWKHFLLVCCLTVIFPRAEATADPLPPDEDVCSYTNSLNVIWHVM